MAMPSDTVDSAGRKTLNKSSYASFLPEGLLSEYECEMFNEAMYKFAQNILAKLITRREETAQEPNSLCQPKVKIQNNRQIRFQHRSKTRSQKNKIWSKAKLTHRKIWTSPRSKQTKRGSMNFL